MNIEEKLHHRPLNSAATTKRYGYGYRTGVRTRVKNRKGT